MREKRARRKKEKIERLCVLESTKTTYLLVGRSEWNGLKIHIAHLTFNSIFTTYMGNINHNHCNKYGIKTEESLHHKQNCNSGKINAGGNVTFAITGSITTVIKYIFNK